MMVEKALGHIWVQLLNSRRNAAGIFDAGISNIQMSSVLLWSGLRQMLLTLNAPANAEILHSHKSATQAVFVYGLRVLVLCMLFFHVSLKERVKSLKYVSLWDSLKNSYDTN